MGGLNKVNLHSQSLRQTTSFNDISIETSILLWGSTSHCDSTNFRRRDWRVFSTFLPSSIDGEISRRYVTTNSARLRPRWDLAWANLKFGVPADLPDFKFFQCPEGGRRAGDSDAVVEPRP